MQSASLYEQNNGLQKRDALSCLEQYASKIKWKIGNNKIIDIGCGDGSVTNLMKKYFPREFTLVGCDLSESMVKFANDHNQDENTSFIVLDIAGELPDNLKYSFGNVFSFYALHWVRDQKHAFNNVFNLLEQDGECFMTLMAWSPFFDSFRILAQKNKWKAWLCNVENYISPYHNSQDPVKEIVKMMENIGFVDIDVMCKNMFYIFDNMEDMRKAAAAIIPFKIPKEKLNEFLDEGIQHFQEEQRKKIKDEHSLRDTIMHYKILIVYGRKPAE